MEGEREIEEEGDLRRLEEEECLRSFFREEERSSDKGDLEGDLERERDLPRFFFLEE